MKPQQNPSAAQTLAAQSSLLPGSCQLHADASSAGPVSQSECLHWQPTIAVCVVSPVAGMQVSTVQPFASGAGGMAGCVTWPVVELHTSVVQALLSLVAIAT